MINKLRQWSDHLLGRGEAAVTTPILDGALKPNQWIEDAEVIAEFEAPTDIASDGCDLYIADGVNIKRVDQAGLQHCVGCVSGPITAMTAIGPGRLAVAVEGREIQLIENGTLERTLKAVDGYPLRSINALAAGGTGFLLATEGSAEHDVEQWQRDLLCHGHSGRVLRFDLLSGDGCGHTLASSLQWPFGILPDRDGYRYCESWAHQLVAVDGQGGATRPLLDSLPGYPSRMTSAQGGGSWMTMFACRSQLVEFVLREPVMRRRMVAEVDPQYWISPALSSGRSFLEPLQGGGVKQMGMIKPWAPARSYGLVVRLDERGRPRYSLHSRVGGLNHGVVAVAECRDSLYMLARGPRRLLRLNLDDIRREFE